MTTTVLRRTGAVLAAAGVALTLTAQAPAADKLAGKTTLAPKAATFDTLAAAGVTVAPSGVAGAGSKGISFPITGGKLDLDNLTGKVEHKGGLTFSGHGTSVTLQGYVIKVGAKNVIRARVAGGGHVRLADLNLKQAKIKQRGGKVVISNVKVLLANKAAEALSATFGLPDLAGANLGRATVAAKP